MIYFDNGATTFPKPQCVKNAVNRVLSYYGANPGRSGHRMSVKSSEIMYRCRESAAKLFDVDNPEKVIFTLNCTSALNIVIKGVLKAGDHVVISSLEHNAVVRPLEFLKSKGIEYSAADYVPYDDEATINNFRNAIRGNTRLVLCTHASNVFGVKLPIERIGALCRIYGILFCVDAAQTAGIVPISLKNNCIDYLCTAGHKGLYGPMGTGLLVINSDVLPEGIIQGGTGSESANPNQPEALPDKYESGTPNLPGIAGLGAGIDYVLNRGEENLNFSEMRLSALLFDRLSKINGIKLYTMRPSARWSVPVISFNIGNTDSEEIARILSSKYNIAVRAGLHCAPLAHKSFNTLETGTVRAVVSAFTETDDVNYLAGAVGNISRSDKFKKRS